ncbi:unnamed protein product [Coccothraustes coccothraustes]
MHRPRGEEEEEGREGGRGRGGTSAARPWGVSAPPAQLPPALPIGDGGCCFHARLWPSLPAPASRAPGALPSPTAAHIVQRCRLRAVGGRARRGDTQPEREGWGGGEAFAASSCSCPRRRPGAAISTIRSPRRPPSEWHRAAPAPGRDGQGRRAREPIGRHRGTSAGPIGQGPCRSSLSANGSGRRGGGVAGGGEAGRGKWDVAAAGAGSGSGALGCGARQGNGGRAASGALGEVPGWASEFKVNFTGCRLNTDSGEAVLWTTSCAVPVPGRLSASSRLLHSRAGKTQKQPEFLATKSVHGHQTLTVFLLLLKN